MNKKRVMIIVFIAGVILGYSLICMKKKLITKYRCIGDEVHVYEIVMQSY